MKTFTHEDDVFDHISTDVEFRRWLNEMRNTIVDSLELMLNPAYTMGAPNENIHTRGLREGRVR